MNIILILALLLSYGNHSTADQAPDFELPILNSELLDSLRAHKGQVILIDFWASWCGPCQQSLPEYSKLRNRIQAKYGELSFEVLAINVDVTAKEANDFLKDKSLSFPILRSNNGKTQQAYQLIGLPSSFLIDQHGTIVLSHQGFEPGFIKHLEQQITRYLNPEKLKKEAHSGVL